MRPPSPVQWLVIKAFGARVEAEESDGAMSVKVIGYWYGGSLFIESIERKGMEHGNEETDKENTEKSETENKNDSARTT